MYCAVITPNAASSWDFVTATYTSVSFRLELNNIRILENDVNEPLIRL